jgi:integrase
MALNKLKSGKYRVTVSVRPQGGGHPICKQVTVSGTVVEAKIAEADLYRELKARSLTAAYASTFGEAVDLFIENRHERGKMSPAHERMVKFVQKELGHIRLEVFADQFAVYRKHIMRSPTSYGKPRKSASVNRYTAIVRAVFGYLVGMEILDKNPITSTKFPELQEQPRDRVLTPEERLRLKAAIREYRPYIWPIIRYMFVVPCRTGELLGAGREQYSPITNTIHVPKSKAGIEIYKPIPPYMVAHFRSIPADCPWLFYRETGGRYQPITKQILRAAWEHCLKAAGLSDYHLHDLRHEAVTGLYRMENSEFDIAAVAGWIPKTVNPMARVYNHIERVEAAGRIVFPPEGPEVEAAGVGGIAAAL